MATAAAAAALWQPQEEGLREICAVLEAHISPNSDQARIWQQLLHYAQFPDFNNYLVFLLARGQKTELVLKSQSIMLSLACFLLLLTETTAGWSNTDSWRTQERGVCIAREREALLSIKAGIVDDPEHILSSWQGLNCCRWEGVRCSSMTGHVIVLDLHGNADGYLSGEISSSLIVLEHLQHLDLSYNLLTGPQGRFPDFIGSLHHLRYLNLSAMGFSGMVPHQIGNLSRLLYLDLSKGHDLYSEDLSWLPRLPLLKHIDLGNVDLSRVMGWVESVGMLPSLEVLRLPFCYLQNTSHFPSSSKLTKLKIVDMSFNSIEKQLDTISWVWDAANLQYLKLDYSGVYGIVPAKLGQLRSLEVLILSGNKKMTGMLPDTLCNLRVLELAENHVQGDVMEFIERLGCSWSKLQVMRLGRNNLTGSLSDQIRHLTSITTLDLSFNKLTGTLPIVIGKLSNLMYLHLRYNQMHGLVTEDHFSSLTQLQELHLSGNSFSMELKSNWHPPFSLGSLGLTSCRLGPGFPQWLKLQTNISFLYMSGAGIEDSMPDWFYTTFKKAASLDLSSNKIRGTLPVTFGQMNTMVLDLSSNRFSGSVPRLPQNIHALDLSENYLSGHLPLHSNSTHRLSWLFLSDNYFTGTIPASLCQMKSLLNFDIGNNMVTGELPRCSGMVPPNTASLDGNSSSSMSITTLSLNNNKLLGEFPLLVQSCPQLTFIDLGQNKFFGSIPAWIGQKLPHLKYMRLSSNMFSGHIPAQLRGLHHLQYLDLSQNNFLGTIPDSLLNMDGVTKTTELATLDNPAHTSRSLGIFDDEDQFNYYMIRSLSAVTKGQRREYIGRSIYMVSIDLSCNHLTGDIPKIIGPAAGLVNMNLSFNHLSGKIAVSIGSMHSLESLDLSSNSLSGEIPSNLANLTLLSYLNLSYNELSGQVPSGNQLRTLNPDDPATMYTGNPSLCGPPLRKSCSGNHTAESKDGSKMMTFYFGLSVGVVVGLCIVFCSLLFKKTWRVSYFWFIDEMCGKIYEFVFVNRGGCMLV